jgi:hypothetical protein
MRVTLASPPFLPIEPRAHRGVQEPVLAAPAHPACRRCPAGAGPTRPGDHDASPLCATLGLVWQPALPDEAGGFYF